MHYFTLQTKTFVNGETYDSYVRKSYHGGWCYVNPKIKGKVIREKGGVYDVNSLYPSVMHSESGCFYPRGKGCLRAGGLDKDEKQAYKKKHLYYFIRFKCSFEIKPDHLPTVQIKGDPLYDGSVWLTTSKIYDKRNNEWLNHDVIMTMTCTDFDLFLDHYDVTDLEIYDHINYRTQTGVFDDYINYWAEIKKKSKGALRTFAKLMLNNLYGKFSTSPEADYIIYYLEGGLLKSDTIDMDDPSKGVYIPVGSAITSWARNFTIRTAQKNFDRFCYADTDSIHFIGSYKDMVGIVEHPTNFCCWKNETTWDKAIFAGQKRYIEEVIEEDHEPCEKYNNIKCCGLNENAKQCLDTFLQCGKYDYDIFREGLMVSGNIKSRRVEGGIFLTEQAFTFRGRYIMI